MLPDPVDAAGYLRVLLAQRLDGRLAVDVGGHVVASGQEIDLAVDVALDEAVDGDGSVDGVRGD